MPILLAFRFAGNKARISYFRQLSVTARNDILEMEDIPFEKIGEFAGLIKDRLCQWSGEHTRLGCDVRRLPDMLLCATLILNVFDETSKMARGGACAPRFRGMDRANYLF